MDTPETPKELTRKEKLLSQIDDMIIDLERLPQHAMMNPITHYDYASLLVLMSTILDLCACDNLCDSCKEDICDKI